MPYVSDRQRKFFHTATARKAGITPQMTNEFDQASKGMKLTEAAHKMAHGGMMGGQGRDGFHFPAGGHHPGNPMMSHGGSCPNCGYALGGEIGEDDWMDDEEAYHDEEENEDDDKRAGYASAIRRGMGF